MDTAARCILASIFLALSFLSEMLYSSVKECNRVRMINTDEEKKRRGFSGLILDNYRMSRSSLKTAKTVFFLLLFYTLYNLISGKIENHVTVLILTALISFFAVFLAGGYIAHSLARAKADDIIRSLSFFAFLIIIVCAPVTALSYALSLPIAMLLPRKVRENDSYTEEELTDIIEKAEDEGIIEEEEREIIHSALTFGEELVADAMRDIKEVFMLPLGAGKSEIIKEASEKGYSRVPLYKSDKNTVSGILRVRDYLAAHISDENADMRRYTVSPIYVSPESRLITVMNEMKKRRLHMAVVRNKERVILGIITMEDILEVLVGDIYDEDDGGKGKQTPQSGGDKE